MQALQIEARRHARERQRRTELPAIGLLALRRRRSRAQGRGEMSRGPRADRARSKCRSRSGVPAFGTNSIASTFTRTNALDPRSALVAATRMRTPARKRPRVESSPTSSASSTVHRRSRDAFLQRRSPSIGPRSRAKPRDTPNALLTGEDPDFQPPRTARPARAASPPSH